MVPRLSNKTIALIISSLSPLSPRALNRRVLRSKTSLLILQLHPSKTRKKAKRSHRLTQITRTQLNLVSKSQKLVELQSNKPRLRSSSLAKKILSPLLKFLKTRKKKSSLAHSPLRACCLRLNRMYNKMIVLSFLITILLRNRLSQQMKNQFLASSYLRLSVPALKPLKSLKPLQHRRRLIQFRAQIKTLKLVKS